MVGPLEFFRALYPRIPTGYGVELRRVPGLGYLMDPDFTMPDDLARGTYYFGIAPRRRTDSAVDLANLVWVDTDGSKLDLDQVYPPLTAAVFSGGMTDGIRHYHLWWRLKAYVDVGTCCRLSILATLAYGGDYAVCESARVMRVPNSLNSKRKDQPRLAEVDWLDPGREYDVIELEEKLVAAVFAPHWLPGQRHEMALNIAAALARAGWSVDRAQNVMRYLYEVNPGSDLNGKLTAVRTTYQKKEDGEPVVSRMCREALGQQGYRKFLDGLGISTRDSDLVLDGEVVGTRAHLERDISNYVLETGDWGSADGRLVLWTGKHWAPVENEVLRNYCFGVLARMQVVEGGDEIPYIAKAAKAGAIASIVIGALLEAPLPEPNPIELPLENGVLNLETLELVPHRREQHHRWLIPINYDPSAQCPTWERFVLESAPQEGMYPFLQEWSGYCLMAGNPWQRMLWLHGPSGTGKSTFLKVLHGMLGPSATAVPTDKFTEYSIAQLSGKRVGLASELSPRTLKTSILKGLIAGDPVEARHPYGRPFSMEFTGKLVWSSNGLPPLDQAEGMRRRINVVEFNEVPKTVDVYLDSKLEAELPGVLNWSIEGLHRLLRLRKEGKSDWALPPGVQAFIDEYMEAADPLTQFFIEEIELGVKETCVAIQVYQRYVFWAKERQVYVVQWGPEFYRAMRSYGLVPVEDQQVGKRAIKVWEGGRLKGGFIGSERRD